MLKTNRWVFLFQSKRGHKFFRDTFSGGIAIADDSGATPDQTDDGVLRLDQNRAVRVRSGDSFFALPLRDRHGNETATIASAGEAADVCSRFNMRLEIDGRMFSLVEVVQHDEDDHKPEVL